MPLLVSCALVLCASACRVRAEVAVDVQADGSGVVQVTAELDPAAARRLGDPGRLQLDDLREAGWDTSEPVRDEDGSLTVVARKGFDGPDQLATLLEEVGGPDGVFRDVRLEVDDRFGSTEYRFATEVHLTGSPEQFSDPLLAGVLDGMPLGRSAEELAAAGADDPRAITLELAVSLPGGDLSTGGEVVGRRARWAFPVTGGEPTDDEVMVSSVASRGRTGVLVGVAAVAGAGAVAAVVVGLVRRRG